MLEFIFTTLLMLCLGVVLYLTVRALPRIEEEPENGPTKSIFERWAHSELPEKVDVAVTGFLLKFLRRMKIIVLRIDNALAKSLRKVQPQENRANTSIDFKEISGQNTEDEETDPSKGSDGDKKK